ncbi:hypothetical protein ACLEE6_12200 [Lonsdalea quercina]|uniref:hypothetical protein n=1 Tax=Lonsdalea quercina TaxID=71657 RepID=UPI0039759255
MKTNDKFIDHIIKIKNIVNEWPQWKKDALGTSMNGKNFSTLSFPVNNSLTSKK